MKFLKMLADHMREELDDAFNYATLAVCNKEEDRQLSDMFYQLSKEQIGHAMRQYNYMQQIITKNRQSAMFTEMNSIFKWEEQHFVQDKIKVSSLLAMYK